ncbi:hypothetical protein C1940_00940 [Lactiplantibacillus plantarum subsp. plantarum]|nr:hypothetical protein C1940_00940 [Lactiplantibacillus plantarum subsp. plantarum]
MLNNQSVSKQKQVVLDMGHEIESAWHIVQMNIVHSAMAQISDWQSKQSKQSKKILKQPVNYNCFIPVMDSVLKKEGQISINYHAISSDAEERLAIAKGAAGNPVLYPGESCVLNLLGLKVTLTVMPTGRLIETIVQNDAIVNDIGKKIAVKFIQAGLK